MLPPRRIFVHDDSRRDQRPSRLIALRSSCEDTTPTDQLRLAFADRYRIEREAGGMATVYLAADLKHNRNVAIAQLGSRAAREARPGTK